MDSPEQRIVDGVAVHAASAVWSNSRPVVVFVPGFMREATALFHLAELVPAAAFVDLPGQGKSEPCDEPSVERFSRPIVTALDHLFPERPLLIVGESLGALAALHANRWPVVAVEPPLTNDGFWSLAS